jgi:type I restriction enzyme S subunit
MIMSFKLTVGRVSILDIDAVHNEAIVSIFPLCDSEKCLQKYLFNILPSITSMEIVRTQSKGRHLMTQVLAIF